MKMPDSSSLSHSVCRFLTDTIDALYASDFVRGILIGVLIVVVVLFILRRNRFGVKTISIPLPFSLGNMTFERTDQNRQIAWQMYVQLKTRKAALPFDPDSDVIVDVYDSLYELFPIVRDLLSKLPLKEIKRTEGVADLLIRVQNFGLRPHLTKWQARFRKWWNHTSNLQANIKRSPQELQKTFPQYHELIEDIERMNVQLSSYADSLLLIARADKTPKPSKVKPEAPTTQTSSVNNTQRELAK